MLAFYKERSGNYIADIVTSKTFVYAEKDITASKLNQIISGAVIQPSFVTAKPASSTLDPTDQLLEVKGAGTYATITGQQLIDSVSASVTQNITPTIWSVRLRSFNAVGNPAFECDQINIGNLVANANAKIIDRWAVQKTGTLVVSAQQLSDASPIAVPTTSFAITNKFLRVTLTTQQISLAAGDVLQILQNLEGPRWRELSSDVHSISLLVRSSVSGLKFGVELRDSGSTRSLAKLCTIPSANTWTLITLPNIPIWAAGGSWTAAPGLVGYQLIVTLAGGTSTVAPANDTWQNGNFYSALGQDNFASKPVSSTFDIAFVQHEPGNQSSTLIDCPFGQNLDGDFGCLRYFQKSYPYPQAVGATSSNSFAFFQCPAAVASGAFTLYGGTRFSKPMAKTPTGIAYNNNTGAANTAFAWIGAAGSTIPNNTGTITITGVTANSSGISALASTGSSTSPITTIAEWTADTGW